LNRDSWNYSAISTLVRWSRKYRRAMVASWIAFRGDRGAGTARLYATAQTSISNHIRMTPFAG